MKKDEVKSLYFLPLIELMKRASRVHEENFPDDRIQASALLSIKTGGCSENCTYCAQSAHYKTGLRRASLSSSEEVLKAALAAKESGASRFCMGAAWREVREGPDFDHVLKLVAKVKSVGLETCCTLGMLKKDQAKQLKEAGLDYYNHNIDTSPEHYEKIVQTRTFQDRLETIQQVRDAGIKVCTGGILGIGESDNDRISFIHQLVSMVPQPESLTVNLLVPIKGTPLQDEPPINSFILVRVVAVLRVLAPKSRVRLSAGREKLSAELQMLCFLAGANSIFLGEKLLTSPNRETSDDINLLSDVGLELSTEE